MYASLPFTGFSAIIYAVAALGLGASGLVTRFLARKKK